MSSAIDPARSIAVRILEGEHDKSVPAIVDALNLVFPNTPRSIEAFLWKHYENPQGPSIITYAFDTAGGAIVGVRTLWRCDLYYNNQKVRAYQPCDTATHPEYRRFGLFTRMTSAALSEAEKQGTKLLFNFPNSQSEPAYLKLGWISTNEMIPLLRPIKYGRVLIHALAMRNSARRKFCTSTGMAASQEWKSVKYPSAQEASYRKDTFYSLHDEGYVNWRYRRHPYIRYGAIHDGGTAMVYRTGNRGALKELQLIEIIDWRNRPEPGAVARLVGSVADLEQADIVTAVLSRSNDVSLALSRAGFFRIPSKVTLAYRLVNGLTQEERVGSFSVFAGDLDTF